MPVCDVNGCDLESDSEHAVATHKGKEHPEEGCWKECDNCGEEFRVRPSKSDQRENCSTECMKDQYRDSFTFIVLGTELPCDFHLEWEERHELLDVIERVTDCG